MSAAPAMLTGFKVLDFSHFVAGPTCTRILGEMGAEVIKVEPAPGGDRTRIIGYKPKDPRYCNSTLTTYFYQHNLAKKSIAVDFSKPRAIELLKAMVPKVDIVAENYAPGVMARHGLGYEALKLLNPALIMCSVSMAGRQGPLSTQPGYDYVGESYAGVTGLIGEPDRAPAQLPIAVGDISTGVAAAMAVGFALIHRMRTGEGQHLDLSLIDTYFHMHDREVPKISLNPSIRLKRSGPYHPDGGAGSYRYRDDQYVYIVVQTHQWPQLVRALGMPELLDDPRFNTPHARRDHPRELAEVIEGWLSRFPTRDAALAALQKQRVPCAPVLTVNEAMAHPHLRERRTVRRISDPRMGEFDLPGVPAKFSAWPDRTDVRAPLLGEHNEEVLRGLLGLSDEQIADLYAQGVVIRDPVLEQDKKAR